MVGKLFFFSSIWMFQHHNLKIIWTHPVALGLWGGFRHKERRNFAQSSQSHKIFCAQGGEGRWNWSWGENLPGLLQQHLLRLQCGHRKQDGRSCKGDTACISLICFRSFFSRLPSIFSSTMCLWPDIWEKSSIWLSSTARITRWVATDYDWSSFQALAF